MKIRRVIFIRICFSLGFERNFFDDLLFGPKHLSTNRLIHYPSRLGNPESIPKEAWDGDVAIVTGELPKRIN